MPEETKRNSKKPALWRVAVAYLLDELVIFFAVLAVILFWGMFCTRWGIEDHSTELRLGKILWYGLGVNAKEGLWPLAWGGIFVYFVLTEGLAGASLGKKLVGIRLHQEK